MSKSNPVVEIAHGTSQDQRESYLDHDLALVGAGLKQEDQEDGQHRNGDEDKPAQRRSHACHEAEEGTGVGHVGQVKEILYDGDRFIEREARDYQGLGETIHSEKEEAEG